MVIVDKGYGNVDKGIGFEDTKDLVPIEEKISNIVFVEDKEVHPPSLVDYASVGTGVLVNHWLVERIGIRV